MNIRCLVVEDATYIREIYVYTLSGTRFQIVGEAGDGVEAVKMITKLKPDIIILDLVLPLKNGMDVLKETQSLSPQSRFLVVSSLNDEAMKTKAKSLGAIDFIEKPFSKAQLLASLVRISENYGEVQNG